MRFPSLVFETSAYTNSATPAGIYDRMSENHDRPNHNRLFFMIFRFINIQQSVVKINI